MNRAYRFDLGLDRHMVEHARHRDPSPTITAPPPNLRMYSGQADANRTAYFAQSAASKGGHVAPIEFKGES